MNKHSMRWISLILSFTVMIGSLAYIAAGFNAETTGLSEYIASALSSSSAGVLLDEDDIISTDNDRMPETVQDTWVYETVLRDNGYLVNENGSAESADIYLDMVTAGDTSSEVGDNIKVAVTMENTTANDTTVDSETKETVSAAVDVESISFSLAYDASYLKFVSGESNIEGVEFTATGTGAGAAVQVSYASDAEKPAIQAHEMPVFTLNFEAVNETVSGDGATLVYIEDNVVAAPATLEVKTSNAEEYKIYSKNGNSALSGLNVELKNDDGTKTGIILNPDFDPEVNDYFITIPCDTVKGSMVINAVTADPKAKAECTWASEDELAAGINRCTVTVTAADGSEQEYNIVVKKLALETLADPQTTLIKTVRTLPIRKDIAATATKTNDTAVRGNDYVVYIAEDQRYTLDLETIKENTANHISSTLTVIDMSLDEPTITFYDLYSSDLKGETYKLDESITAEEYMSTTNFSNSMVYLIKASSSVSQSKVTEKIGYTEIVLPDDANMDDNLDAIGFDEIDKDVNYVQYNVNYEINGVNDILADGNDYVVYISSTQTNKLDLEAIRANTANLDDSTLTVIDVSSDRKQIITYDLSSPALDSEVEYVSGSIDPEEYVLSDKLTNDNKYLILTGGDAAEATVTERTGYTEILLPDDANMTQNLTAAGIDNTAAEFVFILDFSSVRQDEPDQVINNGMIKALFGYDDGDASTNDIPGYIKQVENMLSNDSTAKITILAVGADIGAGLTEAEWEAYGIQFVNIAAGEAVLNDSYSYDLANSVYRGQTYLIPQAENEIWGSNAAEIATESEQHNIWEYGESFNERFIGSSTSVYNRADTADAELLAEQYDAAMLEAKALLENANNAHLVVLTPNEEEVSSSFDAKIGASAGIDAAIIPVNGYRTLLSENDAATEIYEELVVEAKDAFNCDPGSNQRTITLVDEINRQVYQLTSMNANMSVVNASALEIDSVKDQFVVDVEWYLPAIGEYELYADYTAARWSNLNVEPETHYYPISNTVKTETGEDNTVTEDDIPTIAPSYDDEYELTVTKAIAEFEDMGAVQPEVSKITYVLLYTNTGVNTLTYVGITDSQIMLAGNDYKVYILEDGKLAPDSNNYPLSVNFTSAGGNKGEATINSLDPGETIYVEYTITVPESSKVTTGTTRTESGETDKVITSYVIDNIATGASEEVEVTQVELKVEFEYDKDSGGTVSTSSSSTSSTTSTTSTTNTTLPTVTTYKPSTTTTTKIIYKEDISTGESGVGYIVAVSLLFGAVGVFGVTVYGIMIDKKIARAASASGRKNVL